MKKILALFLAFALVFSAISPSLAESSNTEKYSEAGKFLEDLGLLKGDGKGNLGLDSNLLKQHMVVMMSRLYGEENVASNFQGVNIFKDLKPKHRQDIPYITWANSKDLINGKPDGTFGIDQYVIVQEYQTVLLRALGYEQDAKDWLMVPQLSQAYGLMENTDVKPSAKMNRGVMAMMTLNALKQEKNGEKITLAESLNVELPQEFKVDVTTNIENNNIYFEGKTENAENLWISLKPISSSINMEERYSPIPIDKNGDFSYEVNNLEVGEYEYRFQSGDKTTKYTSFKIDAIPFKLDSVGADNLKEIYIKFTHAVDKTIASLPSNYTSTAGTIKDVRFEEDGKTIIISLNEIMVKDVQYRVSASKLKSTSGEEITLRDYEFKALDSESPQVENIVQLGNKGIRIYFSEPVKRTLATNFKVNSNSLFGKAVFENNYVSLLYHGAVVKLANGEHKLEILDLEDYSGKKLSKSHYTFTLKDDKKAPALKSISATMDKVIIEFDKDIDPESVGVNNIYWQSRDNKYPKSVEVVSNKIIADFSNNILPNTETSFYIIGVLDYFGNKFSEITKVKAIADSTIADVSSFKLSDDGSSISITYNKAVFANDKKYYTLIGADNKNIDIKDITGSGREYRINLFRPLPLGLNRLEIDGVPDASDKDNLVSRFRADIQMKDREKPKIISHTGYGNNIVINFSKEMDISTITNASNYIMKFKDQQHKIPVNTSFIPGQDKKSVTILLPEIYSGEKLLIGRDGNISQLNINGLKDISGNDTDPLMLSILFDDNANGNAKSANYYTERPGRHGVLTRSNTIKIKFNMPIVYAGKNDFTVDNRIISSVIADGSHIVTIELEDEDFTSIPRGAVRIVRDNNMRTYIDTGVESETVYLWDEIAPRIKKGVSSLQVYRDQIEIPFTEDLESAGAALYRRDLEIFRLKDNKLLSEEDYTTSLDSRDNSILIITINNLEIASDYSVRLIGQNNRDNLSYIRDKDGNLAIPSKIYSTSDIISVR